MVLTRTQKQALAAACNPLKDAGILKQVFRFLPGNYLFLSAVCREWKALYAGIADQCLRSLSLDIGSKLVTCGAKTTLYSAAVASPATIRLACSSGLASNENKKLQVIAGLVADIQTLTALRELGMLFTKRLLKAAALSGRLHILQHLIRCIGLPNAVLFNLTYYAARGDSISMLTWLQEQGFNFGSYTCAGAAEGGHLTTLQHLRSRGCDWHAESIGRDAATGGSIEVLEWVRQQQGIVIDADAIAAAAGYGQIAMCQHLRSIGCDWDTNACTEAARCGRIDMLRWLREHGCPWTVSEVCIQAARNGHSSILDFIIEQGEVLNTELLTDALNQAGACSELRTAQWLRQHGADWPAVLSYHEPDWPGLEYSVRQWCDDVLAWARAEGCTSPTSL
jgi:hypothetical protein